MNRTVRCSLLQVSSSCSWSFTLVRASSAPNGSSIKRIEGFTAYARAIAQRCRMPPESIFGNASANCSSPTISMKCWARSWRSAFGTRAVFSPNSTFLRTVSHGKSAYCWKMTPRSGPGPETAEPSTSACPSVGWSSPARMLSNVLLPQPDGPTTVTNSLSAMSSETWSRAVNVSLPRAKVLVTPWTEILGEVFIGAPAIP